MHVIIAGGTGFIGKALIEHFQTQNATITVITRDVERAKKSLQPNVNLVSWDQLKELKEGDVVINLAGENLFSGLFTPNKKRKILQSRLDATKNLVNWIQQQTRNITFISASGITIYPPEKDHIYYENSFFPNDTHNYMQQLAVKWEQAANAAISSHCRVINLRLAVVLDESGGMLQKILPIYKKFSGITFGSGEQVFLWVALKDVVSVIDFIINHPEMSGPVNVVTPEIIPQKIFAEALAKKFNKKVYLKIPGFLLKLIMLELADELLLKSPEAAPGALNNAGYEFKYPTFQKFLESLT